MRLVLGTAQLGMNYGIANKTGQPDLKTAREIVKTAWEGGIRCFDTAQGYGDSERILGDIFSDLGISKEVRVITKPDPHIDHKNRDELEKALKKSLTILRLERLHGLMLHRESFLDLYDDGLYDIMRHFVEQGLVEHIGISLYSPDKALPALDKDIISMLQVPANMCDQRFYKTDLFELAKTKKTEIYIRSVFLQGLLLMSKESLPEHMKFAVNVIDKVEQLCQAFNLTKQELSMCYIMQKYPRAFIVVGAETQEQLKNNIDIWKHSKPASITAEVDRIFADLDERIINPTLWPHGKI